MIRVLFPDSLESEQHRISLWSRVYRWRLSLSAGGSAVTVVREEGGAARLLIRLPSLRAPWLLCPTQMVTAPVVVTPAFVNLALKEALAHGWSPDRRGPDFVMTYTENSFVAHVPDRPI